MSTLCISSLFGWPQSVLCFDFGALVFIVAVVADVCVTLATVKDPRPLDTASISRSAILTEDDAFFSKEVVVIDLCG